MSEELFIVTVIDNQDNEVSSIEAFESQAEAYEVYWGHMADVITDCDYDLYDYTNGDVESNEDVEYLDGEELEHLMLRLYEDGATYSWVVINHNVQIKPKGKRKQLFKVGFIMSNEKEGSRNIWAYTAEEAVEQVEKTLDGRKVISFGRTNPARL